MLRAFASVLPLLLLGLVACQDVTVDVVEVASVSVEPSRRTLVEGGTVTLGATVRGTGGEILTARSVGWSSGSPAVARVDGQGAQAVVTAVSAGQAVIEATVEGVSGEATITVLVGPSIVLSRETVGLTAESGASSGDEDVQVTNGGNGELSGLSVSVAYGAGEPGGWLTAGLNGTTAPTSVTVVASAESLAPGDYSATVSVSSPVAGGLQASFQVDLTVEEAPPFIVLDPDAVGLSAVENGQSPAEQRVDVINGGGGILDGLIVTVTYPLGQPTGWLDATLNVDEAPATIQLFASPIGLAPGDYEASVTVFSLAAVNSPVILPVTFTVNPAGAPARSPGSGGLEP